MIRLKEEMNRGTEIDLTGPDGNAYAVMNYAEQFGKQLSFSTEKIDEMLGDMMSSDYEHLIGVFEKHFGEYVTLWK